VCNRVVSSKAKPYLYIECQFHYPQKVIISRIELSFFGWRYNIAPYSITGVGWGVARHFLISIIIVSIYCIDGKYGTYGKCGKCDRCDGSIEVVN